MQPIAQLQPPTSGAYTTFRELADNMAWLQRLNLTLEDFEKTVTDACRGDLGATPSDIVRYVIDQHGLPFAEEDRIRWFTAFFHTKGAIEQIAARRYRAARPRAPARVIALVAYPPDEHEAFQAYIFRGRPAWMEE